MEMYVYKSEEEEIYNSKYHCHFNKRLAEWAIGNMMCENPSTRILEPIKKKPIVSYVFC